MTLDSNTSDQPEKRRGRVRKKCAEVGCYELLPVGTIRCAQHDRGRYRKVAARDPFYGRKQWIELRDYKRSINPLCEECLRSGRVTAMTVVHHKLPKRDHPELALKLSNLESLCESCHNRESQREGRLLQERAQHR